MACCGRTGFVPWPRHWGVDSGEADAVLGLAAVEHGDRVAVGDADDAAHDGSLCRYECRRKEKCRRKNDPADHVNGSAAQGIQVPCSPAGRHPR